jgi:hypothetical protein
MLYPLPMRLARALSAALFLVSFVVFTGAVLGEEQEIVVEGGTSADGRYELRRPSSPTPDFVRLVEARTGAELSRMPLARPRLPDSDAPPCVAVWHPAGQWFALLDHEHRMSTSLALYAVHQGKAVRLNVPDYVQNALGRVDATEATLPCESKAGLWNGDDLSVILIFNAPNREGKWVLHNAVANLRVVPKEGKLPEVKLEGVKIIKP